MTKKKEKNIEIETEEKKIDPSINEQVENEQSQMSQDTEKGQNNLEKNDEDEEKKLTKNPEEEVELLRDEKLRLLAEMDNLRKRANKDRVDSIKYGCINLARDILSPDDNLSRALEAIPEEEINSETISNLVDGLKIVQKEFSKILEKHGVKKIDALNKKFDHNFHQAMVEIENDDVDEGLVVEEMQCGYTMHDRLLRPSMVGVSKKSSKNKNSVKKD